VSGSFQNAVFLRLRLAAQRQLIVMGCFFGLFMAQSSLGVNAQSNVQSQLRALVERCGELHGVSVATRDCLREEDKRYGAILENLYRQALDKAGPARLQVRDAQRAWIKAFQAECNLLRTRAAAQNPNPIFAEVAQMGCELKWTLERIDALEQLVQ
jgi:uncharacterized protein YecT (DUF1311 family)